MKLISYSRINEVPLIGVMRFRMDAFIDSMGLNE